MQPNIKAIAIIFRGTSRIVDRLSVSRGMARSSLKRNLATLSAVSLLLFPSLASLRAQTIEQYAITDTGVALRWSVYVPPDGGRHPAVIVLHAGGFKSGFPGPAHVAKDLARAGFVAFTAEYRLAPPHDEMNAPEHPPPSQNTVVPPDDGHYPKQTKDIQTAIRAARRDPRCNGLVYCVGGSTGGSHTVYLAARGSPGDDMPDLIVSLSGIYDFANLQHLRFPCRSGETCFWNAIINYVGVPDFQHHQREIEKASPITYVTSNFPPAFIMAALNDTTQLRLFDFDALLAKLESVGITESISLHPEAHHYKQWVVPTGLEASHAFDYWEMVRPVVIDWLQAGPPRG